MCVVGFELWVGLTLAQTSIQIRILKQVLAAERQRQQDTQVLLDSIAQQRPPGAQLLTTEPTVAEAEVLAQLQVVTARQNEGTRRWTRRTCGRCCGARCRRTATRR